MKYKRLLIAQFVLGYIYLFTGGLLAFIGGEYYGEYYNFILGYSLLLIVTPIVTFILYAFGFLIEEDICAKDDKYIKGGYSTFIGVTFILFHLFLIMNYSGYFWETDIVLWFEPVTPDWSTSGPGSQKFFMLYVITYAFYCTNSIFGRINKQQRTTENLHKILEALNDKVSNLEDRDWVNIPDTNFQKVLIHAYDIEVIDDKVAFVDVKNIWRIDCKGKDIHSLRGIEYFTNLKELDCSNNQITRLDLSKSPELELLYCNNNQLTSLNISSPNLRILDCSNNQLARISFPWDNNAALTDLNCSNNNLSDLNYPNYREIQFLDCSNNQFASLNLYKHTKLYHLNCNQNELTSLDTSKSKNLRILNCADNQLKELNLSSNPDLTEVKLEGNPGTWWKELERKGDIRD